MANLLQRIASFRSSAQQLPRGKPICLARQGFYLSPRQTLICYKCGLELETWSSDEDVSRLHRERAPHCELLNPSSRNGVNSFRSTSLVEYLTSANLPQDSGTVDEAGGSALGAAAAAASTAAAAAAASSTAAAAAPYLAQHNYAEKSDAKSNNGKTEKKSEDEGTGSDNVSPSENIAPECSQTSRQGKRKKRRKRKENVSPSESKVFNGSDAKPISKQNAAECDRLSMENAAMREARLCKVCMDQESNTVFLPCGHLIACNVCAEKLVNCAVCRTVIKGTVRAFRT